MPTSDSVIAATRKSSTSSSTSGIETSVEYRRSLNIESTAQTTAGKEAYLGGLTGSGFKTLESADNEQSALKDGAIVDTVASKTSENSLSVTLVSEGSRTKTVETALGRTIEADNHTLTIANIERLKEICPPDTSCYYTYCAEQPNKTCCVAADAFKCAGGTQFSFKTRPSSSKLERENAFNGSNGVRHMTSQSPAFATWHSLLPPHSPESLCMLCL